MGKKKDKKQNNKEVITTEKLVRTFMTCQDLSVFEMVRTLELLDEGKEALFEILKMHYPKDDCVGICDFCDAYMEEDIEVPIWAREEAGLSEDIKLYPSVVEGSGQILLEPAEYDRDINDIKDSMRNQLLEQGICLGALNVGMIREEKLCAKSGR